MLPERLASAIKLMVGGRLDEARAGLASYLQSDPHNPRALQALMFIAAQRGEHTQAKAIGEQLLAVAPGDPMALSMLAEMSLRAGDLEGARGRFEDLLRRDPAYKPALYGLTQVLQMLGRSAESLERIEAALRLHPRDPGLLDNRSGALVSVGRAADAVEMLRDAVRTNPQDVNLATAYASALNYADGTDPNERRRAAQRVAGLYRRAVPEAMPFPAHPSGPDRELRVGVISGDLRSHSVGFFADPLMALPGGFSTTVYSTSGISDPVTERLKSRAGAWREVAMLDFAALAMQIRGDRIDILFELSGFTVGHRLPTLRLRPAPVQITAIGYPATVGMEETDYRLVDSHTDPAGAEAHGVERLLRLDPCFLCYRPPESAPEVRVRDAGDGGVVFGSFNAVAKLSDTTVRMWSRVVRGTAGSRLVLKAVAFGEGAVREALAARFVSAGVERERLEFLPPAAGTREHLEQYGSIDVALDTVPYNGTTTTCEALLMGVPVVTLAGRVSGARVGVSLLSVVGLKDLIAADEDGFVRIATGLARDDARRAELRRELRGRVLASPLCDQRGYGEKLGALLREVWREACERA